MTKLSLISISFFAIGLMLYTAYRYRRDALLLLTRHAFDKPTQEDISSALADVNASCGERTFGVKRTANIPFRGQRITLVLGPVGRLRACGYGGTAVPGPTWGFFTSLFALADNTQAAWMAANSDVFSPAYLG